jgi:hypothetical protein
MYMPGKDNVPCLWVVDQALLVKFSLTISGIALRLKDERGGSVNAVAGDFAGTAS